MRPDETKRQDRISQDGTLPRPRGDTGLHEMKRRDITQRNLEAGPDMMVHDAEALHHRTQRHEEAGLHLTLRYEEA